MVDEFYLVNDDNQIAETVESFFDKNGDLVALFLELLRYSKSVNPLLTLRRNSEIMGVSEAGAAFVFYLLVAEGVYYIKFKSCPGKEEFKPDCINSYKSLCDESIVFIRDNSKHTKNTYTEQSITDKVDEALTLCSDFFQTCGLKVTDVFDNRRVSNAINRIGIIECSQIKDISGKDLAKAKNLGRTGLRYIIDVCNELYEKDFNIEFKKEIVVGSDKSEAEDRNIWKEIQERTRLSILVWLSEVTEDVLGNEEINNAHLSELLTFFSNVIEVDDHFNDRQKGVLNERVIKGITLDKIASEYGVSRERIRQITERASRKIISRIKRGSYNDRFQSEYSQIMNNVDDASYPLFLAYIRKKSKYIWLWIRWSLSDDAEKLDSLIDLVEMKGKLISPDSIKLVLPDYIHKLRKMGEYGMAVDAAKNYTKKFGRSIYSDMLFIEIANTYLDKEDFTTASKFATYVQNKDLREYYWLMQALL